MAGAWLRRLRNYGSYINLIYWLRLVPLTILRMRKSFRLLSGVTLFALGLATLIVGHFISGYVWHYHSLSDLISNSKLDSVYVEPIDIWKSNYSTFYHGCSKRGPQFSSAIKERSSNGYLLISTSGGLNQQRIGITDAVVVAHILNATLVLPELDHASYWKDDSNFVNIFDVNWFISFLAKDVTIVKRVPDKFIRSFKRMRVPRKSPPKYYLDKVLPILLRKHVLHLTKFDFRLSSDLDEELQKLRCRVDYHALRFTKPIHNLGQRIVRRMQKMANRFVAIHLRFEPDMLAFSGCYYGGGEKEINAFAKLRKRWATLPNQDADKERQRGKCPLSPREVGLMLRALGFTNDTYVYVASGEIYGGEETMQPLRELFPNFYTKEILASEEELKPFKPFSSRLAAIDYVVCDESDVFIPNNNGNMAKVLSGRRRYMGHKRTIRPNSKQLSALFMEWNSTSWDTFTSKVRYYQRGFMGEPNEMEPGKVEFHEYPYSCICQKTPNNDTNHSSTQAAHSTDAKREYRNVTLRNLFST